MKSMSNIFKSDLKMVDQTVGQIGVWKPVQNQSYETMVLEENPNFEKIKPAGFRRNGILRQIKRTFMLHEIRQRCILKKKNPILGVCITMYNEDEEELKLTLKGILQNYNAMRVEKNLNFCKEDLIVFCICDGYEKIPASFKKLATDKGFFDEEILIEKGFLEKKRDGSYKMKDVRDLMDDGVEAPKNILHLFTASTWDFGHDDPSLKMRRINFIFAVK